mgnify:FL=1
MRFLFFLFILSSCALANVFSPEYYENQAKVLRKLDIQTNYISDLVFVESKESIKKLHSRTLAHSTSEYYEFIPVIRQIIKENDLPKEFLYLAIVESGLKSHSASSAKATGIWQFMEKTAQSLNLRVDKYVDERKDPFKSTLAAANYLKDLRAEFGKWYLAILAYNCGNGKLRQAIKEAGSDDLVVLLDEEKKYLPQETRDFIKKILTLAFLANNEDFLFEQDRSISNLSLMHEFIKVQVPSAVSLKDLARVVDMPYEDLKKYNPHFRYDFTPPDTSYYMYIPLEKSLSYEKNYNPKKLAKVEIKIPDTQIYIVKSGDTLSGIAKKHGITVASIRANNKIKKDHLSLKQKLILPVKVEFKYAANQNSKKTNKSSAKKADKGVNKVYIVKSGDTLWSIAKQHGISVAAIKQHNNIKKDQLSLKQKLILPIKQVKYAKADN